MTCYNKKWEKADELESGDMEATMLPEGVPEWLSPIVAVVPGQIFALHLTLVKGHDPDQPLGLQKVTLTR